MRSERIGAWVALVAGVAVVVSLVVLLVRDVVALGEAVAALAVLGAAAWLALTRRGAVRAIAIAVVVAALGAAAAALLARQAVNELIALALALAAFGAATRFTLRRAARDQRSTLPRRTPLRATRARFEQRLPARPAHRDGSLPRLDSGRLGIVAVEIGNAARAAELVALETIGRVRQFRGWSEWTAPEFEVESAHEVATGIDGESVVLEPPLRFRVAPSALRIRRPPTAVGLSPAALTPGLTRSGVRSLWQIAAGRG